jgi:hypothetical protein
MLENKLDNIHSSIIEKLEYFISSQKIPNIIFHGPSGSGKRTIVKKFIENIYYDDKEKIQSFVVYVNCAHGKGIKFIREELKLFAKTHIHSNGGNIFKSIILLNADKLTMDAQSALRRCIELFSHNTRFFMVVEDKYNLLKPILSRFCEIYIPEPEINGETINLYKYNLGKTFKLDSIKNQQRDWLKRELNKFHNEIHNFNKNYDSSLLLLSLMDFCVKLYEKGYSGLDVIYLIENNYMDNYITETKKYELLIALNKVRKEFRNEKLLLLFILNFIFLSLDLNLENISFM